jgi:hypothetical protein
LVTGQDIDSGTAAEIGFSFATGKPVIAITASELSALSNSTGQLSANNQFGISIALNGAGDYLAVGAFSNNGADNTALKSGAVYLFHYDAASLPDDAGVFAQQPSDTVIFASSAISDLITAGTDVTLQASNDITVSSALSVPDGV